MDAHRKATKGPRWLAGSLAAAEGGRLLGIGQPSAVASASRLRRPLLSLSIVHPQGRYAGIVKFGSWVKRSPAVAVDAVPLLSPPPVSYKVGLTIGTGTLLSLAPRPFNERI